MIDEDENKMSSTMVLKLKPVATKKIIAAPSPAPLVSPIIIKTAANARTKYDDNKIAERIPIDDVSFSNFQKYRGPIGNTF